jgi:hypothetical protein
MAPILMRSREEWYLVVEEVRKRAGEQPEWKCLAGYYNVCISSILTPESMMLWNMYVRSGRGGNETWQSYLEMPALVAEAFEIFDAEIALLRRAKERQDRRLMAAEIEMARSKKGYGRR